MKLPLYLRVLLGLALVICAWVFWQDSQAPEPVSSLQTFPTPARNDRTAQTLEEVKAAQEVPAKAEAAPAPAVVDIFTPHSWVPPAPVVVTKPPVPQPPPMPFKVSAQWRYHNQQNIVVLTGNGKRYTLCKQCDVPGHIKPGTRLDNDYRLDTLSDTAVVLTYVPMKHATTLYLNKK
ncbi:hypothetical protein [Pseudomonas sp.]|uniref:hypothetical protein n=1 Tax=Pseudomonas sp. TaxID=306 RepID=UPI0026198970|nr:hypothetical protein [Pseudomonas sp.]